MREPVSRTLSAFQYFYQNRGVDISAFDEEMINKKIMTDLFIQRSKYVSTINILKSQFNESDVLFLFYEDMMAEKRLYLDKVCDFLNVDRIRLSEHELDKKINSSSLFDFSVFTRKALSDYLLPEKDGVEKLIGYVPDSWRG